jgi:hypothetical protein
MGMLAVRSKNIHREFKFVGVHLFQSKGVEIAIPRQYWHTWEIALRSCKALNLGSGVPSEEATLKQFNDLGMTFRNISTKISCGRRLIVTKEFLDLKSLFLSPSSLATVVSIVATVALKSSPEVSSTTESVGLTISVTRAGFSSIGGPELSNAWFSFEDSEAVREIMVEGGKVECCDA